MISRQWSFSNFRNARLLGDKWLKGKVLQYVRHRVPSACSSGWPWESWPHEEGVLSLVAKCEGTEHGSPLRETLKFLSCEILALPLTPTLVQVDLEFCCSHLRGKWAPWAKALAQFRPSSLYLGSVYLKRVDFRLPEDFQRIRSPEVPSNCGSPAQTRTHVPLQGPCSSLLSPFD